MAIFKQADFSGGLDAKLDATKSPSNTYPLLVNGRMRRNVIAPVNRHIVLTAPQGNVQGLYSTGATLYLFVSGIAYYADITASPIIFFPVVDWVPMSAVVERIYAELVPATANLFNRAGTPDSVSRTFNANIAVFQQALFCFDGQGKRQAILPDNTAELLGDYASWTKDEPIYVPDGILPCFASNKLFLVAPDGLSVLSSVSGRASDFVVNLDNTGNKGGDASTTSQTVSFNKITALKALATGDVLVGTLFGTHQLQLDYTNTQFGEPYELPVVLFPAGPINELSIVDVLSDTAFITQSGIHAFNAVMQAKRESNNFPFGARIKGLLTDPITEKSIVQSGTCATIYDDNAYFAVNTIHGYGAIVYDTVNSVFQSLDLSFGRVKQFAVTKLNGQERLFFINGNNEVFEAFASSVKETARVYLGEFTPDLAEQQQVIHMVNGVFTNVRSAGQAKVSIYLDRQLKAETVIEIPSADYNSNLPFSIPFPAAQQIQDISNQVDHLRGWKSGVLIEWNFAGDLSDVSIDGAIESADNVSLAEPIGVDTEQFAFFGNSGYTADLAPGGNFPGAGYLLVNVVKGARYIYFANTNGPLVNGSSVITEGVFTAAADTVAIKGTGAVHFSLRPADPYLSVIDAINKQKLYTILHGGNFGYPNGSELDVLMSKFPLGRLIFSGTAGPIEYLTGQEENYFNHFNQPRHYFIDTLYCSFFFYNGNPADMDGTDQNSLQAAYLKRWLASSTKQFKFVVLGFPTRSNATGAITGFQWIEDLPRLTAILSAGYSVYERFNTNGFPSWVVGTGGQPLGTFVPGTSSAYRLNNTYGFLRLKADPLACRMDFLDTTGTLKDSYAVYPS